MEPIKRLSPLKPLHIAAFQVSLCVAVVVARVVFVYGSTFWQSTLAVNFIASWIPAVIGVLVAIVPDKDLERHRRIRWRFSIAGVLVFYSFILWHQQVITEANESREKQEIVGSAVSKSNAHSDEQFAAVKKKVGDMGGQVGSLGQSVSTLTNTVQKTTTALGTDISKVVKPEPPELAKLQYSLWREGIRVPDIPLMSASVTADKDDVYDIGFLIKNSSSVSAKGIDIWIRICDFCTFASEPEGFDRPTGTAEQDRHITFAEINPGAAVARTGIRVKNGKSGAIGFTVLLIGSCTNCGGSTESPPLTVYTLPFTPQ